MATIKLDFCDRILLDQKELSHSRMIPEGREQPKDRYEESNEVHPECCAARDREVPECEEEE